MKHIDYDLLFCTMKASNQNGNWWNLKTTSIASILYSFSITKVSLKYSFSDTKAIQYTSYNTCTCNNTCTCYVSVECYIPGTVLIKIGLVMTSLIIHFWILFARYYAGILEWVRLNLSRFFSLAGKQTCRQIISYKNAVQNFSTMAVLTF